jgi:hypothetical protein
LRGDAQEEIFATVRGNELGTDGDTLARLMHRQ